MENDKLADKLYEIRTLLKGEKRPSVAVRSALQLVERLEAEITREQLPPSGMRASNYATIEAATDGAVRAAKANQSMYYVIADQPHDGGFAISHHVGCDREAAYMVADALGQTFEGPKAKELPINFTGALPH